MTGVSMTFAREPRMPAACLALACLALWAFLLPPALSESAPLLRIGYPRAFLGDVDVKDAQAAFDIFAKEFASQEGFHVERTIYEDGRDIVSAIRQGEIDLGIVTTPDYVRSKHDGSLEVAVTRKRSGKTAHRQVLLVKKDSPAQGIQDLKRARLVTLKADPVGLIYLNGLLARKGLPAADAYFSSIDRRSKSADAVHALFFGKADLCLVNESFYHTAVTMNRQLGERLKVLDSSPALIDYAVMFRKGYEQELKRKVMDVLLTMKNRPRGQQFLTLLRAEDIVPLSAQDLQETERLLSEMMQQRGKRR